jgi:twitching motility protein PilT
MTQVQRQLGDVLVEFGMIGPEQWASAEQEEARTGNSAWRVLLEKGEVSERDLVRARAAQIGIGFADVRNEVPSPEALMLVPQEVARRQAILPLRVHEGVLVVATSEPRNHLAIEELSGITGLRVVPAAAYRPDLFDAIERGYVMGGGSAAGAPAGAGAFTGEDLPLVEAAPPPAEPAVIAEEDEREPNLAEFMTTMIRAGGSDLHLTAGLPPMIRVHGEVRAIKGFRKLAPRDLQEMVYSILTQKQREIFEDKLELDVSYALPNQGRFRVNVFQQRDSVGTVMRLIPYEIKTLEELGLPPAVKEMTRLRRGLVLVTGVTGSGKSTTLAAMVDVINSTRPEHIMTVEEATEYF